MPTPMSPTTVITSPITGPLTLPDTVVSSQSDAPATTRSATRRAGHRVAVVAVALALLMGIGILLCAFALPARAATVGAAVGDSGSGIGTPQTRSAAAHPVGSSTALMFAGLCVAGIIATAGGVLWYTIRTRRTLD